MPSVDNRIVRMEFDNTSFERNVQTTLVSLAQLDKAMKLEGSGKGFQDINTAASHVSVFSYLRRTNYLWLTIHRVTRSIYCSKYSWIGCRRTYSKILWNRFADKIEVL